MTTLDDVFQPPPWRGTTTTAYTVSITIPGGAAPQPVGAFGPGNNDGILIVDERDDSIARVANGWGVIFTQIGASDPRVVVVVGRGDVVGQADTMGHRFAGPWLMHGAGIPNGLILHAGASLRMLIDKRRMGSEGVHVWLSGLAGREQ